MVLKEFNEKSLKNKNNNEEEKKLRDRIISCEEAIEEIGFGKVQISVLFVTFLVLANTMSETMGVSFIIPAAVCDLHLSTSDKGLLSGMTFLGVMTASHLFGFLADTQGRRIVVLSTLFGSTISTLISTFMKNFTAFLVLRFISGVFVAGYSAIMYAYLGEYSSNKYRASMLTWVTTGVGVVSAAMPLIAYWIMSYDWNFELYSGYFFRPWRLLIIIYSIPGIVAFLWLYLLPESPRFLLTMNRNDEALDIIKWIYRTNKGRGDDNDLNIAGLEPEASEIVGRNNKGIKAIFMSIIDQTLPLFKPPYAIYFVACCSLHYGLFSVAGGFALFMPDILNKLTIARDNTDIDLHICDVYDSHFKIVNNMTFNTTLTEECDDKVDLSVYMQTVFVGIGYLIGFIVLSLIIKSSRRRTILVVNYAVAGIAGLMITFQTSKYIIIALFSAFIFFAGVNVPVINSAAVDIFPTYLRSMAVCCSMLFGRLGTTISSNILGAVLENHCQLSFFTFSGLSICCCVIALILPRVK